MQPSLKAKHISKTFPGVRALHDVSIDFYPGEVHALIGENGAGKSSLIKVLSGVYMADEGQIVLEGKPVRFTHPRDAIRQGIAVIHQELSIASDLTAAENIFLGLEPKEGPWLARKQMEEQSQAILDQMEVDIQAKAMARDLTAAQQQMLEIAKVIQREARVVIMDEPSSSLSEHEMQALTKQIHRLRKQGVTLIYISHRMVEIFDFCDRVTVLRDGEKVMSALIEETDENEIVHRMVGREIHDYYNRQVHAPGRERLRVENLRRDKEFKDVSFAAYAGEILGFAGLVGAGRTEVMETIFGARKPDAGLIYVDQEVQHFQSPKEAIAKHLGMVTEDRRRTGLMLRQSVEDNLVLPSLEHRKKGMGGVDRKWCREIVQEMIALLRIRTPSAETCIANLSGGNQQKVILARWLAAESQILILDEPTRGIDVNAKSEFYALMNDFVAKGGCILMVSSELPEILGISDRILVMREGQISGELSAAEATEEAIIRLATLGSATQEEGGLA